VIGICFYYLCCLHSCNFRPITLRGQWFIEWRH
jgi:hypothetical protein